MVGNITFSIFAVCHLTCVVLDLTAKFLKCIMGNRQMRICCKLQCHYYYHVREFMAQTVNIRNFASILKPLCNFRKFS